MISHLPTLGGEECAAVFLLRQQYSNAGGNPVGKYMAIATTRGEYDGYG